MLMSFGRPQGLVFVRTVAKFGFRRVLYKRKWTFRPFFLGKGTFFAHSFEESELFCTQFFRRKWTSQAHFFFLENGPFFALSMQKQSHSGVGHGYVSQEN